MLVQRAGATRTERYDRWYRLLKEEVDLIAKPGARIITVGRAVAEQLQRREFPRQVTPVIHYSPLASRARTARLAGHEDRFREFEHSVSLEDVVATAREVLSESRVPAEIYDDALSRVTRSQLSESRRKLIYCYKLEFEAVRSLGRPLGGTQ